MKKKLFIILCLVAAFGQLQAQVVEIIPALPQKGDRVTIIYHTGAHNALIGSQADSIYLMFTSSTFYDQPWKMKMVKSGSDWKTSFVIQPYATFGTFYIQGGGIVDKPSKNRDYALAVYQGSKRVKDGYYHESFSIKTQMPGAPDLLEKQIGLLQRELEIYPDNFQARIRLLSITISKTSQPDERLKLSLEAKSQLSKKFEEAPTDANNVTMIITGYALIGEGAKADSIRRLVIGRYPASSLAMQFQVAAIAKQPDTSKGFDQLEALLKAGDQPGTGGSLTAHKMLFQHYAAIKNENLALQHAAKSLGETTPYTPRELRDIAAKLTANHLAPVTAFSYAERALQAIDQWPAGLIRNLDGFGYVRCFVEDNVKRRAIEEARSTLNAIMALNKLYLGEGKRALYYADLAASNGATKESLMNIAAVYEKEGQAPKAFSAYWEILKTEPSNDLVAGKAKASFLKFNSSAVDFNARLKNIIDHQMARVKASVKNQLLNLPGPELLDIVDLSGKSLDKNMLKGKIVVMDFWATWCVPCMKELPYLQNVYNQYKDDANVVFMVINSGASNTIEDARNWTKKNKQYSFPLYFNNDTKIGEKVGFSLIPTVAILDKAGKLQYRTVGFEGTEMEAKLSEQIKSLMSDFNR